MGSTGITVIIPIYNMEKFLPECLESVLTQTLSSLEVICIDDGSTDQSLELLKKYQENDKRIVLIHQENQGVASARNTGLKTASKEYVCFMDPDDFYPDNHVLEDVYMAAKTNQALICGGSFSDYNHVTGEVSTSFENPYKPYTFEKEEFIDYRYYQYDYGYHRFIYNLKMIRDNQICFPPYKRFQDPPFFVKAMLSAERFYSLKRICYRYRYGHQIIHWDADKVVDLSKGICENLEISKKYELNKLHAYTVRRFIDQKYAFIDNVANASVQKSVYNILLSIRKEMLQEKYDFLEYGEVFNVFHECFEKPLNQSKEWEKRYLDVLNSRTFKIGKMIAYLPRLIMRK